MGQLLFGVLADVLGRRKLYGLEFVMTIFAILGLVYILQAPGVFLQPSAG
jgi:MFS family permease